MRILVTIPHYFRSTGQAGDGRSHASVGKDRVGRQQVLKKCITTLHQLFGRPQCIIDIAGRTTSPTNVQTAQSIDVVICTTGEDHLLEGLNLGAVYYEHHRTKAKPILLGFECHAILSERFGRYDYYCYLEDDLFLHDPWFFVKLQWFNREVGANCLLLPHRYEVAVNSLVHKAYIDGPLAEHVTAPYRQGQPTGKFTSTVLGQPIEFALADNPHSGCFFLNAGQMEHWAKRPYFLDRATHFIGPLESAATLGILRTFRLYKPGLDVAAFLEVEHAGTGFVSLIRLP